KKATGHAAQGSRNKSTWSPGVRFAARRTAAPRCTSAHSCSYDQPPVGPGAGASATAFGWRSAVSRMMSGSLVTARRPAFRTIRARTGRVRCQCQGHQNGKDRGAHSVLERAIGRRGEQCQGEKYVAEVHGPRCDPPAPPAEMGPAQLAGHKHVENAQAEEGDVPQPSESTRSLIVFTEPSGDWERPVEGPEPHDRPANRPQASAKPPDAAVPFSRRGLARQSRLVRRDDPFGLARFEHGGGSRTGCLGRTEGCGQ